MSSFLRRTTFVAAAGLLWAYAAGAAAANLVTNPDFVINLNGWTAVSSGTPTFTLDDTTGDPSPPSAHIVTDGAGAHVYSDCVVIGTSQNVDYSSNVKVNAVGMYEIVWAYSDPTCSSVISGYSILAIGATSVWTQFSLPNYALPAGTQSVNIDLNVFGSADVNFDHIQFGPTGTTPVRLQAFDID